MNTKHLRDLLKAGLVDQVTANHIMELKAQALEAQQKISTLEASEQARKSRNDKDKAKREAQKEKKESAMANMPDKIKEFVAKVKKLKCP